MDAQLVQRIRENMASKSREELLKIWEENDKEQYTEDAFEAVKQLLIERGVTLLPQNKQIDAEEHVRRKENSMRKFVFEKIVAPESLREMLEKELGTGYRLAVKKKEDVRLPKWVPLSLLNRPRLEVVQNAAKGCFITTKEKDGKTICSGPHGFMPSGGLRVAIVLGFFALLFVIGLSMGYLVIGIGFIPAIILMLLMKAPSRELVSKVSRIMARLVNTGTGTSINS